MRSNVHDFINAAKAKASIQQKQSLTEGLFLSEGAKNSIFNQQKLIRLDSRELHAIKESISLLAMANEKIASALAVLNNFEQFDIAPLQLAGNFSRGTSYMLEEFLQQQKGVSTQVCDFKSGGVTR